MTFYENALLQKRNLESLVKQIEKRLPTYPEGKLCFQKHNNIIRAYQEIGQKRAGTRKRKYLNCNNLNVAKLLAKKYCDELYLSDCKRELCAINQYLKESIGDNKEMNKIYDSWELYAPYLQNKDEITLTPEESDFINEAWIQNTDHPEHLTVKISESLTVRSKSEGFIAASLDKRGLNYRYECITKVLGYNIAADFTVFSRKQNCPVIWEHFGRMEDEKYHEEARWKIDKYLRAGYIPYNNIIFTFETPGDPFTIEKAEKVLAEFFD